MSHLGQDGCRTKGRMGAAQWEGRCRTEGRMGAAPQYKLTASFDFWEEIKIKGLRTEGEMSKAGIGEAAKQRRR